MAADLRPFVVELSSRENTQRRRVNMLAESREEAAHRASVLDDKYVGFKFDADGLAEANETALYVPKDSHVGGRFVRAGKVIRTRGDHDETLRHRRAALAMHHQEQPYRVDRVGDTSLSNVLASMYGLTWQKQLEGGTGRFAWATDTFKVALTTSSYTPAVDTHDFFNDVTNEVTGTGYTAGGATLASKTSTYDTATDQVRLDAADVQWTTSTITGRYAVIYQDTAGASSTDPVLGFVNFESDVSTTAGTFQITWDATGIFVFDLT